MGQGVSDIVVGFAQGKLTYSLYSFTPIAPRAVESDDA
jgi:hypothetical protein